MTPVWIWTESKLEPTTDWLEPLLGDRRYEQVVLKPNWVRDFHEANPDDAARMAELVTSPALIARVAEQVGRHAQRLIVADAPQFDTNWSRLSDRLALPALLEQLRARSSAGSVDIRDLRQQVVVTDANGVIIKRERVTGDPDGYRIVDLADKSAFAPSSFDTRRLRGSDYDASETIAHHSAGRHEYCIAGTILRADCVVDMPKVKTHKKAGVTLCLKNLVGINGNKNYLPHHRAGSPRKGGDEFPDVGTTLYGKLRAWAIDRARPLLGSRLLLPLLRLARSADVRTRSDHVVRNGNWWRNDTVWRMILDLNRALLYADETGRLQSTRQRKVIHVLDGVVAGEGNGPMAPDRKALGVVIASADAVAADIATSILMGFDPLKIPVIRNALMPHELPITTLGPRGEGIVLYLDGERVARWADLPIQRFRPHPGWIDHIETDGDATIPL